MLLSFIKIRTRKRGKKVKTMQKQETAIYVPVDASRVQWYFLNRTEAFRTRFDAPSEMLIGYKRYDDAVKNGRTRFGQDGACFAILSISFNDHVRNALSLGQWLDDAEEAQTKAPLWRVMSKGAELLAKPANAAMWVELTDATIIDARSDAKSGGAAKDGAPKKTQALFEDGQSQD